MDVLTGFDQEWLWRQLARAVRRRRPLPETLRALADAHPDTKRAGVAHYLADSLAKGKSLPEAVNELEDCFAPGTAAALEAGERSGHIPDVLAGLSDNAHIDSSLRNNVLAAVSYPTAIGFAALAVLLLLALHVNPKLVSLIREMSAGFGYEFGAELLVMQIIAFSVLIVPSLVLLLLYVVPPRTMPFPRMMDALRLRMPLVGRVLRNHLLSRWCGSMDMLIRAGVPEAQAVELAGRGVGNESVMLTACNLASLLSSGVLLGTAMQNSRFFPPMLSWTVRMTESAGDHSHVWPAARALYRRRGESSAQVVSTVLRTTFVILALLAVGVTVASFLFPLTELMSSFYW